MLFHDVVKQFAKPLYLTLVVALVGRAREVPVLLYARGPTFPDE
jgi:hypothetical protein